MIDAVCGSCGKKLLFREEDAGRTAKCPGCGRSVPVVVTPGPTLPLGAPDPLQAIAAIDTSEREQDSDSVPRRPPLREHIAAGFAGGFAGAFPKVPDNRSPEQDRWDQLFDLLRAIIWRLTWVGLCLTALLVNSCSVTLRDVK